MPVCMKANKWVTKVIIIFQLTVWCFVGIMLLQKGVISLRDAAETQNNAVDTQERFARGNENESIQQSTVPETSQQIVGHETPGRRRNVVLDSSEDATQNEPRNKMHAYPTTGNDDRRIPAKSSMIRKLTTIGRKQDTRDARAIQTETIRGVNKNDEEEMHEKDNNVVDFDEQSYGAGKTLRFKLFKLKDSTDPTDTVRSNEDHFFEDTDDVPSNKTTDNGGSDPVLQRSRANRIGTAVAIVMLAIGVVMLVLGPLIVILRAIGDRRRTRQMLKSRCDNDQPPTYEEAVLMDPAPRYSTLELDRILEPSASS